MMPRDSRIEPKRRARMRTEGRRANLNLSMTLMFARTTMVDVEPEGGEIIVVLHWKGGVHTELRLPRQRRGQNRAQTPKEVVEAVKVLMRVCSDDGIAGVLTRNGLLTGRGNRWTRERVMSLGKDAPQFRQTQACAEGNAVEIREVGGLHHHYERRAA